MKKAFAYSFLLHGALLLIIIIAIANVSFKVDKKEMVYLSMEVFNNNEGTGSAARGIETSNSNVNINSKANALKSAKNNIVEKTEEKVEKVEKEVKKVTKTKQMAKQEKKAQKRKEMKEKKEERKRKKQQMEQSFEGAIMAAKGKSSGTGAGTKEKSDGAPKSKGGVDGVFTLKEVDNIPKALKSARPVYPEYAKNMRIEGFVKVRFIVDKNGNTTCHKIVKATPSKVFENAALKAVEQWKFQPALKDGEKVQVAMVVKLNFKLDEK